LSLAPTAVAVAALVSVQLTVQAPPAVAVPGVHIVSNSSQPSSQSLQHAAAHCNAGERVIGGGGQVDNGQGRVMLTALVPGPSFYWVRAHARAAGHDDDWRVTAYAICAPESSVPGHHVVAAGSPTSPLTQQDRTAIAHCPPGKVVIGTGGAINGKWGQVSFQSIRPNTGGKFVLVQGIRDHQNVAGALFQQWSANAFAICADPIAGRQVVSSLSITHPGDKSQSVQCPNGKTVHGVGFTKDDPVGHAYVDQLHPATPLFVFAGAKISGSAIGWNIAAWATCAD